MTSQKTIMTAVKKSVMPVWVPVIAMYVIWCVMSLVIVHTDSLFSDSPLFPILILPFSIVTYIVLALFITQIFMVYVHDGLDEIPFIRAMMFVTSGALGFFLYMLMRDGTVKGGWIENIGTANLIVFACLIGSWMTHAVKRPSELVLVCSVVALADLFSVFAGPTKQLVEGLTTYYEQGMQGPPPLVDFILVKISVPGYSATVPLFGVSDWIILVFLTAALTKFGLSDNLAGIGLTGMKKRKRLSLYIPAASVGLMASLLTAQMSGMFLPALPFVAAAFLVYTLIRFPQVRNLNKKEWVLLSGFSSVMILLLAVGFFLNSTR